MGSFYIQDEWYVCERQEPEQTIVQEGSMADEQGYWRKCSVCKKEIPFNSIYQVCSVSTCRKSVYCSVTCWDTHVPIMNHKESWAEEKRSPTKEKFFGEESRAPQRRIVVSGSKSSSTSSSTGSDIPQDILIVVSKLKAYMKAKHDMNTSGNVTDKLSQLVRFLCDDAVENARAEGRKTLMDRDF